MPEKEGSAMGGGNFSIQPTRPVGGAENVAPEPVKERAQTPRPDAAESRPEEKQALPTRDEMRDLARRVGEVVSSLNRSVHFEIDDSSGQVVTQVVNRETREVIRQIPPEEMLSLSRRLREFVGLLLDIEI